jgi:hypothetical protein
MTAAATAVHAQRATPPVPPRTGSPLTDANIAATPVPGLPPRVMLTPGLVIDGKKEHLDMVTRLTLGPGGQMVVEVGWRSLRGYDSTGKRTWSSNIRQRDEIGTVDAVGWQGSQLWISDSRYAQIALLDRAGTVTKSLELPTWIRPALSNRKSYPVFGRAEVLGLLPDGSMILVPSRPHSVFGATDYDSTMLHIVRAKETGIIDGAIAKLPSLAAATDAAWAQARRTHLDVSQRWLLQPDFWPRYRVSSDSKRIVTVTIDTSATATDTIVVAAINETGHSLWTRKVGVPRRAFTQHEIDSIGKQRFVRGDVEARARQIRGLAKKLPTVHNLTLGRDYSVWVSLRNDGPVRPIVGFDGNGDVIGTAYVPHTFTVHAADRGALWIVDDRWSAKSIVRYSITKPR